MSVLFSLYVAYNCDMDINECDPMKVTCVVTVGSKLIENDKSFDALAPCGLQGCKNGPAPFPGRMSYMATKPGLVFVLYLSMFFIVLMFIRAPFYVLLVFIVCVVCLLVVLIKLSLLAKLLARKPL